MRQIGLLKSLLLAGALALGVGTAAQSAVVYNTSTGAPANFFGTGVVDDNFVLGTFQDSTGAEVELGLRARYRVRPTQPSDGSGLYGPFDPGTQTAAFGSPARADRAEWSYDFFISSINLLGDYTFTLCVMGDCANPLIFDNNSSGNSVGNSLQLLFAGTPGNIGYDVNASGLYNITLAVAEGGDTFGTVAITAQVGQVPEPGSLALLGLGLAGLVVIRKRKQT